MNFKTYWLLELCILALSVILLIGVGSYVLWLNDWLIPWLGSTLPCLAGIAWLHFRERRTEDYEATPHTQRTPEASELAARLQATSARIKARNPDGYRVQFYLDTLYEVVQTVSEYFHPQQKKPYLEVRIPDLLQVVEWMARDLRADLIQNVPGSHIITLKQLLAGQRYVDEGLGWYRLLRVLLKRPVLDQRLFIAWNHLTGQSGAQIKNKLLDLYIERIAHYATELYRADARSETFRAVDSLAAREVDHVDYRATSIAEPLHISVLGQPGAGKSRCIAALFGGLHDAPLPPAQHDTHSYWLMREDGFASIITECAAYGHTHVNLPSETCVALLQSDMILVVLSVTHVARHIDHRVLQQIRALFATQRDQKPPPIIVVLTHIDQLRPLREWSPPYRLHNPDTAKARSIRQALEITAKALDVPLDHIAPVCLHPARLYNVKEGLIMTILQHLDQAQQRRYLRCVQTYRREEYWRKLWRQSKNAGKFIVKHGAKVLQSS